MGNARSDDKKDYTKLTEDEVQLLLENTSFNREQIRKWHDGFLKLCPNGKMNKDEFIEIYTELYPNGKARKFCKQVFKVFDKANTGQIHFSDLMIALSLTSRGDMRKKLSMAFKIYDIDQNGSIDKDEMEKIIDAFYELLDCDHDSDCRARNTASSFERVKAIMSKLDKNNDNCLSREEFINGCLHDPLIRKLLLPNC